MRDVPVMLLVPSLLALFLIVRGAPMLVYRNGLAKPGQLRFALCSSVTSLGLIVGR